MSKTAKKKEKKISDPIKFHTISNTMSEVDGRNTPMESIVYGSYVKIDRLSGLVYLAFGGTSMADATELNIFIDLYSVLHSIFSSNYSVDISDQTSLASAIINMCAHYRSYFKTLGVATKFYLVSSWNCCDINMKFVPRYNADFISKLNIPMYNEIVNTNLGLLELLCPYLPGIYYIKSNRNYESSVIIGYLIEKISNGVANLVITRDLYPLQLTYMYPKTALLFPIKAYNGDNSLIIPPNEHQSYKYVFWDVVGYRRKIKANGLYNISPVNFSLYSALFRFPERYMLPIMSSKQAVDLITDLVGSEDIKISMQQLYQKYSSILPVTNIENRFNTLDIEYMLNYYRNDPESKSIKLQDLEDHGNVNMINSTYFEKNPIDLAKL